MKVLFLEGRRNGYSIEQCGKTFTVSELIDFLSEFDEDIPIYLSNDREYRWFKFWIRRNRGGNGRMKIYKVAHENIICPRNLEKLKLMRVI